MGTRVRPLWNDPSGDNLRDWMGVPRENFMNLACLLLCQWIFISQVMENQVIYLIAKDLQDKWHEKVLALAPDIQLTILVGNYAQRYYLHQKSSAKLTDTVKHYKDYLSFPLVHPLLEIIYGKPKIHGLWKK